MPSYKSAREFPPLEQATLRLVLGLLLGLIVGFTPACADGPVPGSGQHALEHRQLAFSGQDSADSGEGGADLSEPSAAPERIATDEELVLQEEREAYKRAVAETPEIAERVAAARAGLVTNDFAYVLSPTESPVDDSFCTTDRLPRDTTGLPRRQQRIITASKNHRNDVDHLDRARSRSPSDLVSPDSLRELVGTDGAWRPTD